MFNFKPRTSKLKFGFQVPTSPTDAFALELKYNNTLWTDNIRTELNQIHSYDTFRSLGKNAKAQSLIPASKFFLRASPMFSHMQDWFETVSEIF